MPNHVQNKLFISGSPNEVIKLLDFIKGEDDCCIDFQKIIPMPEELNIESRGNSKRIAKEYEEYLNTGVKSKIMSLDDEEFNISKRYYENLKKYGYTDWYDWCCENWGTKWNAYNFSDTKVVTSSDDQPEIVLYFQTAWDAPFPVIDKLGELFEDIEFKLQFADEDIGQNCGEYTPFSEYIDRPDGIDERIKFACDVWEYEYDPETGATR